MFKEIKYFIQDYREFRKYKKNIIDKRKQTEQLIDAMKFTLAQRSEFYPNRKYIKFK